MWSLEAVCEKKCAKKRLAKKIKMFSLRPTFWHTVAKKLDIGFDPEQSHSKDRTIVYNYGAFDACEWSLNDTRHLQNMVFKNKKQKKKKSPLSRSRKVHCGISRGSPDLCYFRPRKYQHSAARFWKIDLKLWVPGEFLCAMYMAFWSKFRRKF